MGIMLIRESDLGDAHARVGRWTWNYGGNDTWQQDDFATREEAEADARASGESNLVVGRIAEVEIDTPDGDTVLEKLSESACDVCGEIAEGYLGNVKDSEVAALESAIADVIAKWLTDRSLWPTFWTIEDIQPCETAP